jgi:hypothetical protein
MLLNLICHPRFSVSSSRFFCVWKGRKAKNYPELH